MNILVIPTTDWLKHPVPNRLNFIFDEIGKENDVYVLGFDFVRFGSIPVRSTNCKVVSAGRCDTNLAYWYISTYRAHSELIGRVVKENDIDVIVSANILPSFNIHKHGVPVVYDYLDVMHEAAAAYIGNALFRGVGSASVYEIVRKNLLQASKIITITPGLRNYILDTIFRNYKRFSDIHIIPNGVDTELFKPSDIPQEKKMVYVGSIEPWVDLELPIRAISNMDLGLHIYGPSLHTDYRQMLIHRACNNQNVFFHDYVPYHSLPEIINGARIGLNPLVESDHNMFSAGGKMFNYLACGVPMLTTRFCSPPYSHEDEAYWFYNNEEDFRSVTEEILSKKINREKLHRMSMKYDWKTLSKQYLEVLEEACK